MILNLCLHLFCLGALLLFCPSCPLSWESSHVVAVLYRLVPDLPPADFIKHALSVTVHPMAQTCPLPSRLVNTIVSAAKLAEDLVAHRWKLFEIVLKKHHELSAARKAWRASLSLAICLRYLTVGTFLLFSACWTKLATRTNTCCTTSPASFSPVLRLFLAYCDPNPCTQPFLCPSFGQMFLNVMLNYSTASTELDRRASDKTHEEFALGLMDGPYSSIEECPGQHKVARNLVGKVEMFVILTIAPNTGSTKHLSPT